MSENSRFTQEDAKRVAQDVVNKIKDLVKKGNVTRIVIRRNDNIILNLPVTAGTVAVFAVGFAAPWALIVSVIATLGLNCTVEVEREDGSKKIIFGKDDSQVE